MLPLLQVITRQQCSLCDDAYIAADLAQRNGLCQLEVVDVDKDSSLLEKYGHDVPVLLINGQEYVRHFVEYPKLALALRAAQEDSHE